MWAIQGGHGGVLHSRVEDRVDHRASCLHQCSVPLAPMFKAIPRSNPWLPPPSSGSKVTAGTVNCDGQVTVRAEHSGQQTVIADIVRMVEMAQARTAPIQRTADAVAGRFAYGVMALSAVTFAFWALVGTRAFPQVHARFGAPMPSIVLDLGMSAQIGPGHASSMMPGHA